MQEIESQSRGTDAYVVIGCWQIRVRLGNGRTWSQMISPSALEVPKGFAREFLSSVLQAIRGNGYAADVVHVEWRFMKA